MMHHITPELLRASFFELKKQAAPGVDGETWRDYAMDFERRIDDLHGRIHRGAYRAKPSKRTYIPKPDGRMRPLGIAALEDKIVQQAARTVLECVYEQDFLGFSYGFRPGRSQHRALDALCVGITKRKVNWIIDADIRGFFDNISHGWLMKFLEHRIADQRLLRLLKKWLRAGVSEDGEWSPTEVGTPQGAVITPPTILQTAPCGAVVKRERVYPVYHSDLGLIYLHSFHQCAEDFSPREPIGIVQSRLDALGEFLQVTNYQPQFVAL